jgi:hypothetical protein
VEKWPPGDGRHWLTSEADRDWISARRILSGAALKAPLQSFGTNNGDGSHLAFIVPYLCFLLHSIGAFIGFSLCNRGRCDR